MIRMPFLKGKTRVGCPKTGEEAKLLSDCAFCDLRGPVSLESFTLVLFCKFGEEGKPKESLEDLQKPDPEEKEWMEEEEEENGS